MTNPNLNFKPPRPNLANNIQELNKLLNSPEIDKTVSIKLYFNSLSKLYDYGCTCWAEGDLERAYIYFLKMATIFLEKLSKHRDFHNPNYSQLRLAVKNKCDNSLKNLEIIKPKLLEYYKSLPKIVQLDISEIRKNINKKTGLSNSIIRKLQPKTQEQLNELVKFKRILIPNDLVTKFTNLFDHNTKRGIESCGILSGKIKGGKLITTHLVIPKQIGTYTTCHSVDEIDVFNFHTHNELLPLGWIHTHPDFDCFLSSVDLHMQLGYQLILPEAISIVVAPKREKSIGMFNITKYGMDVLGHCPDGTTFHAHNDTGLYVEAAHVDLVALKFQLVDLRV
jgi:proteasome lid subunit RPN8/RPN11